MSTSCNTLSNWLHAESVASMGGVEELARLLTKLRGAVAEPVRADLSDEAVERMVSIAFHASLLKDEGRYPLFRLFAPAQAGVDRELSVNFDRRQSIGVESLRRLSAGFDSGTHALVVGVEEGELGCHGAISIDRPLSAVPFDQPAFWRRVTDDPGLVLIADGPGEITVTEAGLSLRLKGGMVSEIVPVSYAEPVRRWASAAAEGVAVRVRRGVGSELDFPGGLDAPGGLGAHLEDMLLDLLARILGAAVYQRHGAAIALLPKTGWQHRIQFGHAATGVDIGEMAVGYWGAFLQGQQAQSDTNLRLAHTKRDEILVGCRSLAWIANIDGCVGLSEELALQGFGGEILVSQAEALASPRVFWDLERDRPWPDQTGADLGGTRHRSAFRLCKAVANCLVFVVSEDGELTLIASDEERVHCFGKLSPVRHSAT